jgi:GNAT superfamily N-acetyltransferase
MGKVTQHPAAQNVGLTAPVRLTPVHDISHFDCGVAALNDWLKTNALSGEGKSARTYVVCEGPVVVGYYCISTGTVERGAAPNAKTRQNMPDPIPVAILGRLAVAKSHHEQGLGHDLMQDAFRRVLAASEIIGMRALVVHAINDKVIQFYKDLGFKESPTDPRTLFLPIETILQTL